MLVMWGITDYGDVAVAAAVAVVVVVVDDDVDDVDAMVIQMTALNQESTRY